MARALGISVKTADNHIQAVYRKLGVSSRAAATLFAMETGLVAWGDSLFHGGSRLRSVNLGRQTTRSGRFTTRTNRRETP